MNKRIVKQINASAKRRKHGMSKAKVFMTSTYILRELQERSKEA